MALPSLNVEQEFIFHALTLIWAKKQRKQAFLWLARKMVLLLLHQILHIQNCFLTFEKALFVAEVRLTDSRETASNCPHKFCSQ